GPARSRGRAGRPMVEGLAVLPVGSDLRRYQRDPEEHRGRAPLGVAAMRFGFTELQEEFQREVRNVLTKACTPATIRTAWGEGATEPDRSAWNALAEMGVRDVVVPEGDGGRGLDEGTRVLILQAYSFAARHDTLV